MHLFIQFLCVCYARTQVEHMSHEFLIKQGESVPVDLPLRGTVWVILLAKRTLDARPTPLPPHAPSHHPSYPAPLWDNSTFKCWGLALQPLQNTALV